MDGLDKLKVTELREMAKKHGVKLSALARKAEIIEAIDAALKPKEKPEPPEKTTPPTTANRPMGNRPTGNRSVPTRPWENRPSGNIPAGKIPMRNIPPRNHPAGNISMENRPIRRNPAEAPNRETRPNISRPLRRPFIAAEAEAPRTEAPKIDPIPPIETKPAFIENENASPIIEKSLESAPIPVEREDNTNRESVDCEGILDLHVDGYGFLRINNYLPGQGDIYVSNTMIRRFNLRSGDFIKGKTFVEKRMERNSALVFVTTVNNLPIDRVFGRKRFEDLIPIYPDQRITLESPNKPNDLAIRLIDILAPIGFGQRGMIVSPPKAGKTTLLKKIANAVSSNHPDAHLMVLLIDERPEEVTDMQRSVNGEVLASTFDKQPEHHARLAEMTLDRAQRLVECGENVVILLDSITRLSRAYNLIIPSTGRSLSGGLDPGALHSPKRFFGAARNIEHGGSLTIIATALVDTGSRMDDIIFEEFKGTGNMEIVLDRKLSERRVFPAIDLNRSGTRREELLLTKEEMAGVMSMRKVLQSGNNNDSSTDQLISMMMKSSNNVEFFGRLKGWVSIWEKDGYVMQNR